MTILLTGATGFIGSAVLRALVAKGHDVVALVRTDEKARAVEALGARPVVGDITDTALLESLVVGADGVIHTASPGDATSATVDSDLVDVVIRATAGRDTPYVHTSGIWIFGSGSDLVETSTLQPLPITGWRVDIEKRLRDSDVNSTVIAPAIVYGHGTGIPSMLIGEGEILLVGDGSQHWTTVDVDDLADLYVLALEAAASDEYSLAASGQNPTVLELGEAAARGRRWPVVPETDDSARGRFGEAFADALLLDQQATGAHARETLGWAPHRPSLADELERGSYLA
ncbi:epimerase [Frondihabitans sp. PAMC 28766]|uniref:NAD-dependent epimerase/dehydratase family protein n=1 Tax=Frondihabitans sp. PAMC 28766 TaxID=1795630 RepID=UPI00078C3326|nr:NAD-dependent epimerase/dehydratase family protein [Frondihabitans sp. PAMC 28766]AMM20388.1 epimerase [Frondihabitans sp. PAMC 28766]